MENPRTLPPRAALLDWWLRDGLQVYPDEQGEGRGWLYQENRCPACGHRWTAVAAVGSLGIECPVCKQVQLDYRWGMEEGV